MYNTVTTSSTLWCLRVRHGISKWYFLQADDADIKMQRHDPNIQSEVFVKIIYDHKDYTKSSWMQEK